jgi:hypothetical protein
MSAGFHTSPPLMSHKPPNNYVSGKVSGRSITNMQNSGLGRIPKPAQAAIKVLGRFHQRGDSARPRPWR